METPAVLPKQSKIQEILNEPVCKAGRLKEFLKQWGKITRDKYVLDIISGFKIPFKNFPFQATEPRIPKYSVQDEVLISESISKLLRSGAIVQSNEEAGQFLSTIFTVPKQDGSRRPIINLKLLNEFVENPHFKMESVKTAVALISSNSFMSVIDLKDAYHAIPVHQDFQKYLKFRWKGVLYKYTCIPFGLCLAPWLYTKVNKPIIAFLRTQGVLLVSYLDDTLVVGKDREECLYYLDLSLQLFERLGLNVNREKSQLQPSQQVRFLGFNLDSQKMRVVLPDVKIQKLVRKCKEVLENDSPRLLCVAELIGVLVAACFATRYGMIYTRQLEMEKTSALRIREGRYKGNIVLSSEAKQDIGWWINNISKEFNEMKEFCQDVVIFSDASLIGWGAESNGIEARGNWTNEEKCRHINVLELVAAFYGLRSFVDKSNITVLLRVDSSNAMAYINNHGGCRSPELHAVAKQIWKWCECRNIRIRASYINTKQNVIADRLSRTKLDYSDFMLTKNYFENICKAFGQPNIDLFATYQTKQCEVYYSWKPDPFSAGVDAFTFKWGEKFYPFPPFNLVGKVLNKIISDRTKGIVVVPFWSTQPWFPLFQKLVVSNILYSGPNKKLLYDPYSRQFHQITNNLKLMVAILSGSHYQD